MPADSIDKIKQKFGSTERFDVIRLILPGTYYEILFAYDFDTGDVGSTVLRDARTGEASPLIGDFRGFFVAYLTEKIANGALGFGINIIVSQQLLAPSLAASRTSSGLVANAYREIFALLEKARTGDIGMSVFSKLASSSIFTIPGKDPLRISLLLDGFNQERGASLPNPSPLASAPGLPGRPELPDLSDTRDIVNQRLRLLLPFINQIRSSIGEPGESFRRAINERDKMIFNRRTPLPKSIGLARLALVASMKNPDNFNFMLGALNLQITRLSQWWLAKIISQNGTIEMDEFVLGAGPNAIARVQELLLRDPNRRVMVADRRFQAGGTFAELMSLFLNSSNRADSGEVPRPGVGDLNKIHELLGIPDLDGERYPNARKLGAVVKAGLLLSAAIPLMGMEIETIQPRPRSVRSDKKLLVTLRSVATGQTVSVLTDNVETFGGLGDQVNPFKQNQASRDLVDRETKKSQGFRDLADPNQVARFKPGLIEYFQDYHDRISDPDNTNPMKEVAYKRVLVIGGGNSGETTIEAMMGLGPTELYRDSGAQVGRPTQVVWIVPPESYEKCKQLLDDARSRYARTTGIVKNGSVILIPGRVNGLVEQGGKIKLSGFTITFKEPQSVLGQSAKVKTYTEQTFGGNLAYVLGDDELDATGASTRLGEFAFEKTILATGYETRILETMAKLLPNLNKMTTEQLRALWREVQAEIPGKGKVGIKYELYTEVGPAGVKTGVSISGPNAGATLESLVKDFETGKVGANKVSLYANTARSIKGAELSASERPSAKPGEPNKVPAMEVSGRGCSGCVELTSGASFGEVKIIENPEGRRMFPRIVDPRAFLLASMDSHFRELRFRVRESNQGRSSVPEKMTISLRLTKSDTLEVKTFFAGFDNASAADAWVKRVAEDPAVITALRRMTIREIKGKSGTMLKDPNARAGDPDFGVRAPVIRPAVYQSEALLFVLPIDPITGRIRNEMGKNLRRGSGATIQLLPGEIGPYSCELSFAEAS